MPLLNFIKLAHLNGRVAREIFASLAAKRKYKKTKVKRLFRTLAVCKNDLKWAYLGESWLNQAWFSLLFEISPGFLIGSEHFRFHSIFFMLLLFLLFTLNFVSLRPESLAEIYWKSYFSFWFYCRSEMSWETYCIV